MPMATGSVPTAKTMGIVRVSRWTARVATVAGQRLEASPASLGADALAHVVR
jgi:hypothetical protein